MKTTNLIAAALLALGALAYVGPAVRTNWPARVPVADRPADALVAAVGPVVAILKDHPEDGRRLASFYSAQADVIARDKGKLIGTTAQLRELNRRAGLLAFQRTAIQGKYPGLAEAIDKVLADQIGLDNVPLDDKRRTAAVEALKALAWGCGGGHA